MLTLLLGSCIDFYAAIPCAGNEECPGGYTCDASGVCLIAEVAVAACPQDVVADLGFVVMDAFEASRADASADAGGSEESVACSQPGVIPWTPDDGGIIVGVCEAAGKHVCTQEELEQACGSARYPYGDDHVPGQCNDGDGGAGAIAPTGSFDSCVESTGQVFDLVGNVGDAHGFDSDSGSAGGWLMSGRAQGGGWKADSMFTARCGGDDSFFNSSGDPSGFRCCQ
jgi:hypothetical protein